MCVLDDHDHLAEWVGIFQVGYKSQGSTSGVYATYLSNTFERLPRV